MTVVLPLVSPLLVDEKKTALIFLHLLKQKGKESWDVLPLVSPFFAWKKNCRHKREGKPDRDLPTIFFLESVLMKLPMHLWDTKVSVLCVQACKYVDYFFSSKNHHAHYHNAYMHVLYRSHMYLNHTYIYTPKYVCDMHTLYSEIIKHLSVKNVLNLLGKYM